MLGFVKPKAKRGTPVYKKGTLDSLCVIPQETRDGIRAACEIQRRLFRNDPQRLFAIEEAAENLKDALKIDADSDDYEAFKTLRAKMQNGKGT